MKKMVVIFEDLEEFHLVKDVGMIPMLLGKNKSYKISFLSTLGEFHNSEFEKYIDFKFFTKFTNRKINKLLLFFYVVKQSRKLDVVMCFHGGKYKALLFFILKLLNPLIKTHVKLDMGELAAYDKIKKEKEKSFIKSIGIKFYNSYTDLFTIETKRVKKLMENSSFFKGKLHYLPNGFYANKPYDFATPKEKMIIAVGRIGTPQKNNELLLSAIEKLEDLGGYKFYFIGPVLDSFKVKVDALLLKKPHLKDKIILTGNIKNREELYDYYKRAEVLAFTSLYEGFALVLTEALYFGCYLLSTDLSSTYDVTNNGEFGSIIQVNEEIISEFLEEFNVLKNEASMQVYVDKNFDRILHSKWFDDASSKLALELDNIISGKISIKELSHKSAEHIYKNFNWNTIIDKLDELYRK